MQNQPLHSLGIQIIAEYYDCDTDLLMDSEYVEKVMLEAAHKAQATIVNSNFHTFSPYGVSGVIVIAESHLTIHTWPEHSYAAVDLFTCGTSLKPMDGFNHLAKALKSQRTEYKELKRGIIPALIETSF